MTRNLVFIVVAIESTHDGDFRTNIKAYKDRAKAELEATRINSMNKEKYDYNYALHTCLDEEAPYFPEPGQILSGEDWAKMKRKRSEQRKASACVVLKEKFPRLAAKEDPTAPFDLDYQEYSVEELEVVE